MLFDSTGTCRRTRAFTKIKTQSRLFAHAVAAGSDGADEGNGILLIKMNSVGNGVRMMKNDEEDWSDLIDSIYESASMKNEADGDEVFLEVYALKGC